jgi:hypothetical protein
MPYIFRTYLTKVDPENPKKRIFIRDSKGRKVAHKRWRFEYIDWQGKRRTGTGYESKVESEKLANFIQAQQDEIRKGYRPVPKSSDKHAKRPFSEVVNEYLAWGNSQGGRGGRPWSEWHAYKRKMYLEWWGKRLSLETLSDLNGILPKVESALRELQESGLSGKTLMNYAEALKSFCK